MPRPYTPQPHPPTTANPISFLRVQCTTSRIWGQHCPFQLHACHSAHVHCNRYGRNVHDIIPPFPATYPLPTHSPHPQHTSPTNPSAPSCSTLCCAERQTHRLSTSMEDYCGRLGEASTPEVPAPTEGLAGHVVQGNEAGAGIPHP